MATKAAHTQFNRNVAAYLQSIGAEFLTNNRMDGEGWISTICGVLRISVHEPERSEVFSLFCRFDEPEKAKHKFLPDGYYNRLNDYSGKWNFHSYDAKELLEEFKEQIQPLLINEKV